MIVTANPALRLRELRYPIEQSGSVMLCRIDEFPMTGSREFQTFVIRGQYLAGQYKPLALNHSE